MFSGDIIQSLQVHGLVQSHPVLLCAHPLHCEFCQAYSVSLPLERKTGDMPDNVCSSLEGFIVHTFSCFITLAKTCYSLLN